MSQPSSDPALLDGLADEFTRRLRRGDKPSIEEYQQRFPQLANDIRDLFPTLMLLESPPTTESLERESTSQWEVNLKHLGEYRIVREVGRGGMGVVYEAIQESLGRRVALKVLPTKITNPKQLARFQREARTAAKLHHTNIVPVFEVGEVDGVDYYTMQFIDGRPLSCLLGDLNRESTALDSTEVHQARTGGNWKATHSTQNTCLSLTYRDVALIGKHVAQALAYAHDEGVIHRDIKPANLLIDGNSTVWITDFGLARTNGQEELTSPGDVIGTMRYLSPERFDGHVDERGDIYGLGVTLYEMLTARPAFSAKTRARLIDRILHTDPTAPRLIDQRIPRELETIVRKAMAREPSRRYARACELAEDLERFLTERPILARRASVIERTWRWACRNKAFAAMTAIAVTLLLGISIVSSVASMNMKRQLEVTHQAQRESRERRVETLIAKSRATRLTGRVGQRFEAIRGLSEAFQIARELALPDTTFHQLRNEFIAASCLIDLEETGDQVALAPGTIIDVDSRFDRYALGDNTGNVRVFRCKDQTVLAMLPGPGIPIADYGGVVFSPNGQYLQHLCYSKDGRRRHLRLWELAEQPRLVLDLAGAQWAAFRPDSQQIAVKLPDLANAAMYQFPSPSSIGLFSTVTGRKASVLFKSSELASFTFHPSLPRMAVTDAHSIRIFDIEEKEELVRWKSEARLFPLWDPQGRILLTTNDDDLLIHRRDTVQNRDLAPLKGHKSRGIVYTFSHRGGMLASNDWSGTLRLWDARSGSLLLAAPAGGFSSAMRFSADDQLLSGAGGKGVMPFLKVAEGAGLTRLAIGRSDSDHGDPRAIVSPDGQILAATSDRATVLFNLPSGERTGEIDGSRVPLIFDTSRTLITYADRPEGLVRWQLVEKASDSSLLHVTSSEPLEVVEANGTESNTADFGGLDQWSASVGARVIAKPEYSKGASLLVAFDASTPYLYRRVPLGPQNDVRFCAVSPDGRWSVTGSHWPAGNVTVWDVESGRRVKDLDSDRGVPQFSPDGRWLAVVSNSSVNGGRLWRVNGWKPGPVTQLGHLCFDPSSRLMAIGDELSEIRLVVPESGREVARLSVSDLTRLKPECFSPDGSHLIAFGLDDGQLYVWNLTAIGRQLEEKLAPAMRW